MSLAICIALSHSTIVIHAAAARQGRLASRQADGETLFRAIFFLEGPLADQIDELKRLKSIEGFRKLTPRQENAIKTFQSRLLAELRRTRPEFFQNFAQAIHSGDRVRISRALTQAARLSRDALLKVDPDAARFMRRHEASLRRSLESAANSARNGPPDFEAILQSTPREVLRDAERLELTWLKGTTGPGGASAPKPDTDHSVAVVPYTILAVVVAVIVVVWLVAPSGDSGLLHEQLVGSLASRAGRQ